MPHSIDLQVNAALGRLHVEAARSCTERTRCGPTSRRLCSRRQRGPVRRQDLVTASVNSRARAGKKCVRKNLLKALDAYLRSEEHTSELQSLMRISYAVFCLKKNNVFNKLYKVQNKY